jgi:hydrogenase nickel incorporation protein HypB
MFHSANIAVITKNDIANAAGFNRDLALINLQRVSHHAKIFELSAKTGDGMKAWLDYLVQQTKSV